MEKEIADFLKKAKPSKSGSIEEIIASKDLFRDGWLDSLLNLQLLAFIEKNWNFRVPPFLVARKNFQTIAAIAALANKSQK